MGGQIPFLPPESVFNSLYKILIFLAIDMGNFPGTNALGQFTYGIHENGPIFKTPHTPCPATLCPKFFHPLGLGYLISNEPPPSLLQMIIERKHNPSPKMTIICYQVLLSGRLLCSVSTH